MARCLAGALLAFRAIAAHAGEAAQAPPAAPAFSNGLIELKRQNTARGTPEETTKVNLKLDYFPRDGAVALLRLELPFPDENTSFRGGNLDFGDAKVRVGLRAVDVSGRPVTSFAELTFPTARPESLGTGKYQFSAGAKTGFHLPPGPASWASPRQDFSIQLQQVVSFAGDQARADINQTKIELEWRDTWAAGHFAKATAKPVVDWVGGRQTGAVLEVEGGWAIDRRWTLVVLAGHLLWGEGVPATYRTRGELKAIYHY